MYNFKASYLDFIGTWRSIYYIERGSYPSEYGYGFLYLLIEPSSPIKIFQTTTFNVYSQFNKVPPLIKCNDVFVETAKGTCESNIYLGTFTKAYWEDFSPTDANFKYQLVSNKKLVRYHDFLGAEEFYRIK